MAQSRTDLGLEDMMARTPAVKEDLVGVGFMRTDDGRADVVRDSLPASPEEGRRLIRAFLGIQSAEIRDRIVNLVATLASLRGRPDPGQ
jgi:hypothetical protein